MTDIYREKFVARFGNEQADKIVSAALAHNNDIHNDPGSSLFQWAIVITIGYECWTREEFRVEHGITIPVDELREWAKTEGDIGKFDGSPDYLSLLAGLYNEYLEADDVQISKDK